ncbi:MAG: hypothetical protein ACI4EG_08680 [Fusicatenibacter sp.]|nr:hypothetical protein [Fusicatenibacter sp.]
MDIDLLVNEICKRVQEKISAMEQPGAVEQERVDEGKEEKPKILILTSAHGTICHEALECRRLGEYYQTECALLKEYQCNPADYEAVIAYTLTNEALGKIANGIFDGPYVKLFGEAILAGKKIFVPEEEVELYRYRDSAPKAYYERIESGLKLLKQSGVVIAKQKELLSLILDGQSSANTEICGECKAEHCNETAAKREESRSDAVKETPVDVPEEAEREICIFKHVITEKDVTAADSAKAKTLVVDTKAILTDLAKEYASKRKIVVVRRELSSAKRGQRR